MMNHSILLIDDDCTCLEKCGYFLEKAGYNLTKVETADYAIKMTHDREFAAIVTDIVGADGLCIISNLRENHTNTPIVAISSFFDEDAKKQVLNFGANLCLDKPTTEAELVGAVKGLIEKDEG